MRTISLSLSACLKVFTNTNLDQIERENSHPEDIADVFIIVSKGEEDGQHEEVAPDDDVRFVTLCRVNW